MGRVRNKVAMVTGGRRGIGRAAAVLLAREGAQVIITDRKEGDVNEVIQEIEKSGGQASFLLHDVTREEDWIKVINEVIKQYGKLDILVNNAGVGVGKSVEETTLEEWRWVMSVNLDGVFLGTKYGIKAMKDHGGGSIINMSSIEGLVGDRRLAAYDASKGGVRLLTKSAALSCASNKYNIRVNAVCPGFLNTAMVQSFLDSQPDPEKARQELIRMHPIGHLGEPDDAAYAILYLASDESKFVSGSDLVVDGGYTAS